MLSAKVVMMKLLAGVMEAAQPNPPVPALKTMNTTAFLGRWFDEVLMTMNGKTFGGQVFDNTAVILVSAKALQELANKTEYTLAVRVSDSAGNTGSNADAIALDPAGVNLERSGYFVVKRGAPNVNFVSADEQSITLFVDDPDNDATYLDGAVTLQLLFDPDADISTPGGRSAVRTAADSTTDTALADGRNSLLVISEATTASTVDLAVSDGFFNR
jgi:hypothetical protein